MEQVLHVCTADALEESSKVVNAAEEGHSKQGHIIIRQRGIAVQPIASNDIVTGEDKAKTHLELHCSWKGCVTEHLGRGLVPDVQHLIAVQTCDQWLATEGVLQHLQMARAPMSQPHLQSRC